jgi:hypothetical protein
MNSLLVLVLFTVSTFASVQAPAKNAFTPDQIPYGPVPAFMPDGYRVPPHWHPHRENVTVISGNFKVGMGDTFDETKMMTFGAGSFAYLDPAMHHYGMASGEVVVQVHGMSPLQFNYVNPSDQPGTKK